MKQFLNRYLPLALAAILIAGSVGYWQFRNPQKVFATIQNPCQSICPSYSSSGGLPGYQWAIGFTPNQNGTITQLWSTCSGTETDTMYLWQGSTVLASANVTNANSTWVSTNISSVNVTSGTQYVVSLYTNTGSTSCGFYYSSFSMPASSGNITLNNSCYISGNSSNPENGSCSTSTLYMQVDISYSPSGGGGGPTRKPQLIQFTVLDKEKTIKPVLT